MKFAEAALLPVPLRVFQSPNPIFSSPVTYNAIFPYRVFFLLAHRKHCILKITSRRIIFAKNEQPLTAKIPSRREKERKREETRGMMIVERGDHAENLFSNEKLATVVARSVHRSNLKDSKSTVVAYVSSACQIEAASSTHRSFFLLAIFSPHPATLIDSPLSIYPSPPPGFHRLLSRERKS